MRTDRPSEILVIHPGALGDVLQAVPALRALRMLGARLTFSGQGRLAALLAGAGEIQEALPFEGLGLNALFAEGPVPEALRSRLGRFDRVVSWFGARAEPYRERLCAIVPGSLVAPATPPADAALPTWQHLLETLTPWDVGPCPERSPVILPEAWAGEARAMLFALGVEEERSWLFVHPGAGASWKRWAPDHFSRMIERVRSETGCQVLLHRGPADAVAVAEVLARLRAPAPRALIEPPLHVLAAALASACAYIGSDSGVSQLAAAVGAPALILYPDATRDHWEPWNLTALPLAMRDVTAEAVGRVIVGQLLRPRKVFVDAR